MIRRIQALNYRCLRHIDVRLDGSFHILVGPNASGKSTLMDAIAFLADTSSGSTGNRLGLRTALERRVPSFRDLVWNRKATSPRFELAVESDFGSSYRNDWKDALDISDSIDRYVQDLLRVEIAVSDTESGPHLESLRVLLASVSNHEQRRVTRFPDPLCPVDSILTGSQQNTPQVSFHPTGRFDKQFKIVMDMLEQRKHGDISRSLLNDALEYLRRSQASSAFSRMGNQVQKLFLEGAQLRKVSLRSSIRTRITHDSGGMPWLVKDLKERNERSFVSWMEHVQLAIPELKDIKVVEKEDERSAHLVLSYDTGIDIPSWSVSEGTLRLLALTLIAFLPDRGVIYLIEEPENGLHPLAIEVVYQSLNSVYDSHVFVSSHSPIFLGCADPKKVLCFAKDKEGAVDVIQGTDHPTIKAWPEPPDMDSLFVPSVP